MATGSQATMRPVERQVSPGTILVHDAKDPAVDQDLGGSGVVEPPAQPPHSRPLELALDDRTDRVTHRAEVGQFAW